MKYRYLVILSCLVLFGYMTLIYGDGKSEGEVVEKYSFFVVPHHYRGTLEVSPGDMVQFNSRNLPLTAATFQAVFRVVYDEKYFRLIASSPPDAEGPMSREVYVKALKPGATQLTIRLVNDKTVVEEYVFTVKIR